MKLLEYFLISIDSNGFPEIVKMYFTLEDLINDLDNQRNNDYSYIWINPYSLETNKLI